MRQVAQRWNAARVTYWGVSGTVAGNGTQRGYYLNERADGSRDWGTFEAKVVTIRGERTIEGTWQSSDGTGMFAGFKRQGTYKTRLTSQKPHSVQLFDRSTTQYPRPTPHEESVTQAYREMR